MRIKRLGNIIEATAVKVTSVGTFFTTYKS